MKPALDPQPGRAASRLDGERSRERILDAAEALLAEKGYAGTGIAAISRASGLPASSIYWFFRSKQDLVAAVVQRATERFLDGFGASHREGAPESRLQRFIARALEQSGERLPEFARLEMLLALERGAADPQLLENLRRGRERAQQLLQDALEGSFSRFGERAEALAEELSPLAMAFAHGVLVARELGLERIDLSRLVQELEVAMRAIAEHRLAGRPR